MNWKDYYTSYELSKKIQEIKGELGMDDPYWESPLTFIWLEDDDLITLNSYILIKEISPKILQNKSSIPAYQIFQDICCEYSNEFLRDNKRHPGIMEDLTYDIASALRIRAWMNDGFERKTEMKNLEEFILKHFNRNPFGKV